MNVVCSTSCQFLGFGLANLLSKRTALCVVREGLKIGSGSEGLFNPQIRSFRVSSELPVSHSKTVRQSINVYSTHLFSALLYTSPRYCYSSASTQSRNHRLSKRKVNTRRLPESKRINLSSDEIRTIFGGTLDRQTGNQLLQLLQDQRVSGTLDEDVDASPDDVIKAMAWLRISLPMDEDQAIIARLDREDRKAERATQIAIEKARNYKPQQDAQETGIYGRSGLQEIQKLNKQKAAEREKQKKLEEAQSTSTELENTTGRAISIRPNKSAEWVERYKEAATMKGKVPPNMTKFERLWSSALVTIIVVGLSVLFAQNYIPPSRRARLWPDLPPAAATILAMIGVNVIVFLAWRVPQAWKLMNRTFIVTAAYPFAKTMVGGIFSHQTFSHLLFNMVFFWFIGTSLHEDLGRGTFLAVFFTCGTIATFTSLYSHVVRNILYTSSLGASGANAGLLATWCWIHSDFSLPFMSSEHTSWIPLRILLFGIIGIDIIGLSRGLSSFRGLALVDHVSHLGGYAAGIVAGQILKYRAQQRRRAQKENSKLMEGVDSTKAKFDSSATNE